MSFYRSFRMGAFGATRAAEPVAPRSAADVDPSKVGPVVPAPAPVFPPPPLEQQMYIPRAPPAPPTIPVISPQQTFYPTLLPSRTANQEPARPAPEQPAKTGQVMVFPSGPAIVTKVAETKQPVTRAAQESAATAARSEVQASQAATAAITADKKAAAMEYEANKAAAAAATAASAEKDRAAAVAAAQAVEAQNVASKRAIIADQANKQALLDAAAAQAHYEESARQADADAAARRAAMIAAERGVQTRQPAPQPAPEWHDVQNAGTPGGGGSLTDQYGPGEPPPTPETHDAIPQPDGSIVLVPKKSPLIAIATGAGGGFLVGGPIGALVGAAAGYFISNAAPQRASQTMAAWRRRR